MIDAELDPIIERIALEARRPVAVDPDAKARLIAAIRAERSSSPFDATDIDLPSAREITLPTWRFAALAAGLVGVGVLLGTMVPLGRDSQQIGQPTVVVAQHDPSRLPASHAADTVLTFVFVTHNATSVSLVGDFNQWDAGATPMQRIGDTNAWSAAVPLAAGRHLYQFYVVGADGEKWLADPNAPASDDGFGRVNSVILVGKGSAS